MNITHLTIEIYLLWFLLFYITPSIIFFKLTYITNDLINLPNLVFSPVHNSENNTMYIKNDFSKFMERHPSLKHNIIVKMLGLMCKDVNIGEKLNYNLYLLRYKTILYRFLGYLFLSTLIPIIILQIVSNTWILEYSIAIIISLVLIFIMHRIFCYKYEKFQEVFFKHWYNKILNFDLYSVERIAPYLLKQSDNSQLLLAISTLNQNSKEHIDRLLNYNNKFSNSLNEFVSLQSASEGITYQNVLESMNNDLNKLSNLGSIYEEISTKIENSLDNLIKLSDKNKLDINAINSLAEHLYDIKKMFNNYNNETLKTEIEHLEKITKTLENNINNSFSQMESAVNNISENLAKSYGKFFEVCTEFSRLLSIKDNEKILNILGEVNSGFIKKSELFVNSVSALENSIKYTNESTKKLFDSFDNFKTETTNPIAPIIDTFNDIGSSQIPDQEKTIKDSSSQSLSAIANGTIGISRILIEGLPASWNNQKVIMGGDGIGGWITRWTYDNALVKGIVTNGKFEYLFPYNVIDTNLIFTGVRLSGNDTPLWNTSRFLCSNSTGATDNGENIKIDNPKDSGWYYIYCSISGNKWTWSLRKETGGIPIPSYIKKK